MSSSIHGRDQIDFVKVGAKRDGTIVGLECTAIADFGAFFTLLTPFIPSFTGFVISGCYKIPNLKFTAKGVFTNKMATDATRGAGRPEATHMIEVMMDQVAAELHQFCARHLRELGVGRLIRCALLSRGVAALRAVCRHLTHARDPTHMATPITATIPMIHAAIPSGAGPKPPSPYPPGLGVFVASCT